MNPINKISFLAITGLAISAVTSQAQLSLNFASTPGSTIQFNGSADSFQFNASTLVLPNPIGSYYVGTQWSVGSETGGTGSAVGLFGAVNNGPFSYGPITTVISGSDVDESALVTGPLGALSINDGASHFLTGTVNWIQVATHDSAGSLNAALTVNVTGLAYSGANVDLSTMAANGPGSMNLTFQFSPSMMLSQLSSGTGSYATSYSGSISVETSVPEPASVTFILLGMGALVCSWRLKKTGNT